VVFSGYSGFLHLYKTDRHDLTEILLNVALNTITPYPHPTQKNAGLNGGVG
jgi:hypothetical protein